MVDARAENGQQSRPTVAKSTKTEIDWKIEATADAADVVGIGASHLAPRAQARE